MKIVYMKASNLLKTQDQADWEEARMKTRGQLDNSFVTRETWHASLSEIEMNIRALKHGSTITEY